MNELSKIFIEYSNIFLNFFKNNLTIFFKCTKYTFCMFLSYLIYRQLPFKNKTKLLYLKNDFNNQIAKKLNPINYRPTFFMPDCSMQMIYHQFYPRPIIKFKREYIQTPDKGIFSMDWVIDEKVQKYNKLLVILHGLTGGSEAGYLREIIKEFLDYGGYKIVVIHNRGISDTPLFTPFPFHASFTSDLKFALKIIKQRFPNIFCAALGVSMGANIFVKFLANDYSLNNYIRCFVSISNPLNLEEGEKRNRGTLIDTHLKQAVIAYFSRHRILKANKSIYIFKIFYKFIF